VKACQVAPQLLEVIAGRRPQVSICLCVVDHLELAEEPAFDIRRNAGRPLIFYEEGSEPLVPKAYDHAAIQSLYLCTTLWYKKPGQKPMR
jgi:hypothetical protein